MQITDEIDEKLKRLARIHPKDKDDMLQDMRLYILQCNTDKGDNYAIVSAYRYAKSRAYCLYRRRTILESDMKGVELHGEKLEVGNGIIRGYSAWDAFRVMAFDHRKFEKHWSAKSDVEKIKEIKTDLKTMSIRAVAKKHGIPKSTVGRINNGTAWKWVKI